jgi:phospholipase C
MTKLLTAFTTILILLSATAHGSEPARQSTLSFKKVVIVVLENANYADAMAQPFLNKLAKNGALLSHFYAETHPSLPNYIALTAGTFMGVTSNRPISLDLPHVGDLLEARAKTWKVYAEGYPGNCFLGQQAGNYARWHVPFLSFNNVQTDPRRCARIIEASAFANDATNGNLPNYTLYIPDVRNDGHHTNIAFADRWVAQTFGSLLNDPTFMRDLLFVVTFDEGTTRSSNHIYTALAGASVLPGSISENVYNHYSLLRTIEDALGLGTLGKNDKLASNLTGVWR